MISVVINLDPEGLALISWLSHQLLCSWDDYVFYLSTINVSVRTKNGSFIDYGPMPDVIAETIYSVPKGKYKANPGYLAV